MDDEGNAVMEPSSEVHMDGQTYSISASEITGYENPYVSSGEPSGTMGNDDINVTFTYMPRTYGLTAKYVDESGNELAESVRSDCKYNKQYSTSAKEITGYTLTATPSDATGTMPASDKTVTYVYAKNKYKLTVKYQNEDGKNIKDKTEKDVYYGDEYSVEKENIAGYILTETPSNAQGTVGLKDITVKFVYKPRTYSITYDLNGGSLSKSNPETYTVESDKITLNNPTKDGYDFTGWTGSNGDDPDTSVSIKKGSTGDKKYKANWEMDSDSNVSGEGGTKSLKKGKKNRMESGRWTITGDATIYNGDLDFYVPEDISLTFTAVK
ncbi:MAG: MucBP domain-containing protein [Lachnospiraceae bacterium]|nr:MucBP domain-containing protein [Lachnospiraceae bacterium]